MLKSNVFLVAIACLSSAPLARAELIFETSANLAANIVDDGYNGTLASMTCVNIQVGGTGVHTVSGLSVRTWLDHSWIGDLVLKVVSPSNAVVVLLSRPGLLESADDGSTSPGFGDSSNLVSTDPIDFIDGGAKSAESMGDSLINSQAVCRDDAACVYDPNRGAAAGGKLDAFNGQLILGTWKLCAGDSGSGDTGAIQKARLIFAGYSPATLEITPNTLDFGAVVQGATSPERFVTLGNTGNVELSIYSLTAALPPFQRATGGSCGNILPRVIAEGEQCSLSYRFSPESQDAVSQSFTIQTNGEGDAGFELKGHGDAVFVDGFELE